MVSIRFSVSAPGANLTAAVNVISASTQWATSRSRTGAEALVPNVTRTLADHRLDNAILLQSVTARSASVEWRRFSDGQLVVTQNISIVLGSAVRIDPRTVSGLTDDTQYA